MIGFWFGVGVMLAVGVVDAFNKGSYKRKIRPLTIKWQNSCNKYLRKTQRKSNRVGDWQSLIVGREELAQMKVQKS